MTFDAGSTPPPPGWEHRPPPPQWPPGPNIAPNPYGWAGTPREHPNGTTILVLGILSLVACGVFGPFAWAMGNTALREMNADPGVTWSNRGNGQHIKDRGLSAEINWDSPWFGGATLTSITAARDWLFRQVKG